MLLKSIKLENFRQFVNEQIDFSTDPDRNVTFIIGENGTGKTTFAQAFFWCLYGETSFADKVMLNRTISEKMTPDQEITVRVTLKLVHGSAGYEIIRTQVYRKTYSNKIQCSNSVINISVKTEDGNTRYLKPLECESEIKRILPKELSNYFFFDGERIDKMSKEIAAGKKSSSFASAVNGLTGLNAILMAINHLSPSKPASSVYGQFNSSYVSDSGGRIRKLSEDIDRLQEEFSSIETRLSEIDDEISFAETSKSQFEAEIKQYEESAKLQEERERINKELTTARRIRSKLIKDLCTVFNENMTSFFGLSMIKRALEVVSKSDISGKDIPNMHTKTIDYLLNRGTCICGTQLMEGSVAYNNLNNLRNYLPPQSIGVTVGSFVKEARMKYERKTDLFEKLSDQLSTISEQDETIEGLLEKIDQISSSLGGNDVRSQVKSLNEKIKSCTRTINERREEQRRQLKRQGEVQKEKSLKESSRAELSLMDKKNRHIEKCKAYTQRLYEELYASYKYKEKEIRDRLEQLINEIFKTIYDGGLSISIDEKYNISVYVNDYEGGVETSTAQSISVSFAFISAIIKMAKDSQNSGSNDGYSEPYPLVMDAPLSAFDKRRIEAICKAIPETAEQVIIFIKDTDGELAEKYLGNRVKVRYHFDKIDEFNTRLD